MRVFVYSFVIGVGWVGAKRLVFYGRSGVRRGSACANIMSGNVYTVVLYTSVDALRVPPADLAAVSLRDMGTPLWDSDMAIREFCITAGFRWPENIPEKQSQTDKLSDYACELADNLRELGGSVGTQTAFELTCSLHSAIRVAWPSLPLGFRAGRRMVVLGWMCGGAGAGVRFLFCGMVATASRYCCDWVVSGASLGALRLRQGMQCGWQ